MGFACCAPASSVTTAMPLDTTLVSNPIRRATGMRGTFSRSGKSFSCSDRGSLMNSSPNSLILSLYGRLQEANAHSFTIRQVADSTDAALEKIPQQSFLSQDVP